MQTNHVRPEEIIVIFDQKHWLYDPRVERPLLEQTVLDYMINGVIEPVIVTVEGEQLVVVDGRRRVLHAREANIRLEASGREPIKVKVEVRRGARKDLFGIVVSANEHREDDAPLAKARKAQKLIDFGATTDEIAIRFGVTANALYTWLKLLELCPEVLALVDAGKMDASAALALIGLSVDEQIEKAMALVESGGKISRRRVEQAVDPDKPSAPPKRTVVKLLDYVEKHPDRVSKSFLDGVRWCHGLVSADDCGLASVMTELAKQPAKKPQRKSKGQVELPLDDE